MRKILVCLMCFLMIFGIGGCSNSKEKMSTDDKFISDLKSGLTERWKLSDANKASNPTTDLWNQYIDSEMNKIKSYSDLTFENSELDKLAKEYIDCLTKSQNITKHIDSDFTRFWAEYQPLYDDRSVIIKEINDIVSLKFDNENNQKALEGIINDSELVIATTKIIENTTFSLIEKPDYEFSDFREYQAVVENTYDTKFSFFNYNINLVDENGIVVETLSSTTSNWEPGAKHKFIFGTDEKFRDIVIKTTDYSI